MLLQHQTWQVGQQLPYCWHQQHQQLLYCWQQEHQQLLLLVVQMLARSVPASQLLLGLQLLLALRLLQLLMVH